MRRVYVVHGIGTSDPRRIERFAGPWAVDGHPITSVDYGWVHAIRAASKAREVGEKLASLVEPGSIGVGYSNGCAALALACRYGAPFDRLILLHAALRNAWAFSPRLRRVDVVAARDDDTLLLGRAWRWATFGDFRDHPWGTLGRHGYRGDDPRVHTHWTTGGHGAALEWDQAVRWSQKLYELGQAA